MFFTQFTHFRFGNTCNRSQTGIGETFTFQGTQEIVAQAIQTQFCHLLFQLYQLFNLYQEPAVDIGQSKDIFHGHTHTEGISDVPDTFSTCIFQFTADNGQRFRILWIHFWIEAICAHFQATQCFLHGFLQSATNRHYFTNRFHLCGQTVVSTGKFLEVKARNFGDNIVNGWFERCRRQATGDIVGQFIQGKAHSQFRGNFCNREASGFRCQRRRTGYTWVHLDNNQTTVFRVNRKLYVGTTGFHADFTQYRQRGVTHDLIFFISQGLCWRNGDGVTGVDTHRIEVFDGADDNAVVVFITHNFHFVLFPANQRFINQQLIGWGQIQAAFTDFFELFAVIRDTTTGAAHSKGRTDNTWEANISRYSQCFFHGMCDTGTSGIQTDFFHCFIEALTVFCFINGIGGSTDHGDTELFQYTTAFQFQCAVQCGLATHSWQYCIRALFFDNFAHNFPVDWLDVSRIRHFRVGHNGCRVGVNQDNAVTLFTQRFTRLRT